MSKISIYGIKERKENKLKIQTLIGKVKNYRKWKNEFFEMFPEINTAEAYKLLGYGAYGKTDDKGLLEALEIFIAHLEETLPEWYQKVLISG